MNVKQVILVRKDIKMPKGKLAAQASHASIAPILQLLRDGDLNVVCKRFECKHDSVEQWLNGSFTKVCLGVDDLDQMVNLYEAAKAEGIPCSFIVDEGRTCFSEPTATCCGIGPWISSEIDDITGSLKLL